MEERKLNTRQPKPLKELNVIDDFLFRELMADEASGLKVCRMILETVLKRKIGEISLMAQKSVPGVSESRHGIIMDAYITERIDGKGADVRVFDIEPENRKSKKKSLPKRDRYYADLIDVHLLNSGTDYDELPELVIIFILPYDPFGENAMYYEAGTILKTHPQKEYDDGIRRIYLYTEGELPENASSEDIKLKNLLKYMGNSIKENVKDDATGLLDEIVTDTKSREDVGIRYMKSWEWEKEIREESRQEGREQGEWLAVIRMICKKLAKGKSVVKIADEMEEDEETIKDICEVAKKYAPDYDAETICKEFMEKMKEAEKEAYVV